jgi:hypothetical protein
VAVENAGVTDLLFPVLSRAEMDTVPNCLVCGKPARTKCSKCHAVLYCSRRCLTKNINSHTKVCSITPSPRVDSNIASNMAVICNTICVELNKVLHCHMPQQCCVFTSVLLSILLTRHEIDNTIMCGFVEDIPQRLSRVRHVWVHVSHNGATLLLEMDGDISTKHKEDKIAYSVCTDIIPTDDPGTNDVMSSLLYAGAIDKSIKNFSSVVTIASDLLKGVREVLEELAR